MTHYKRYTVCLETKRRRCLTNKFDLKWRDLNLNILPVSPGNTHSVWPCVCVCVCTRVRSMLTVRIPLTFSDLRLLKYSLTDLVFLKSPINYGIERGTIVPLTYTSDTWHTNKQTQQKKSISFICSQILEENISCCEELLCGEILV